MEEGGRVVRGAIRETVARIRSLVMLISERRRHVKHTGSLKRETGRKLSQ
jgi:chorismate mutase